MSTIKFSLLLWTLLAIGLSCAQAQKGQNLSVKPYKELMDKTPNKTVLDIRTDGEVARGVLPGAIQLDYYAPDFKQKVAKLDKNKPLFIYCAVGGRSGSAMPILQQMGFKNVYNLGGGINAWQSAGYAVVPLKR